MKKKKKKVGPMRRKARSRKSIEPRERIGDGEEEEEKGRNNMRTDWRNERKTKSQQKREKKKVEMEPEIKKREGESHCLSSCATPSSQRIFPPILLCYPALCLLLFLLSPPLFFSLLLFLISSSFSVSYSSHISPLSFRLLALFFLYIPFLALALSLVCFYASHLPLPLLSFLISFYCCFSFSSSTPLPPSSPNSYPMSNFLTLSR
jgi:hypothetical protein